MSAILYYVTGHGYGHAVRSSLVIRALSQAAPGLKIHVRTAAPPWLFHGADPPVAYSPLSIDVGILQRDSLEMDLAATLQACRDLHRRMARLIDREVAFAKEQRVCLVVGDIPPLAFEIAARAGIPSVAVTNFSWNWIYRAYLRAYPEFLPLIEEMETFYRKATLALTLPYPGDLNVFPVREEIPWIARVSSLTKPQAKAEFELPASLPCILLSFGGLGLQRLPWEQLKRLDEFFFVATDGETHRRDGNLLILPSAQLRYHDLVRAADVIVTKPGYGIVADALAHRTPVLYTDRGEFSEYARLVQALSELAQSEFIEQADLLSGRLATSLRRLANNEQRWPRVALNGAAIAAQKIAALLGRPS